MNQYDIIIQKLTEQFTEQITKLSKDNAIHYALYVKAKEKITELEKELSELKNKDE